MKIAYLVKESFNLINFQIFFDKDETGNEYFIYQMNNTNVCRGNVHYIKSKFKNVFLTWCFFVFHLITKVRPHKIYLLK